MIRIQLGCFYIEILDVFGPSDVYETINNTIFDVNEDATDTFNPKNELRTLLSIIHEYAKIFKALFKNI